MAYKVPFVNYPLHYKNMEGEIDRAIKRILLGGDLILRGDVEQFERSLSEYVGTRYAVGVNSCTDALRLSLMAAGIGQGDEVITVSHTFVASISSVVHCGATPVLVDVGEDFTMDPDSFEEAITSRTKAVMPVHLNGHLCQMDRIAEIAGKHDLIIIEDAAQGLGATLDGKMGGSYGLAGCFSFYPAKLLGAFGDAGAAVTSDEEMAAKIRLLRDHGRRTKNDIALFGFTSRLHNIQAAILNVKLKYLPQWIERRREIAQLYDAGLADLDQVITAPKSPERYYDTYQNYVLRVQERDALASYLREKGVETIISNPIPNHHQGALGLSRFKLPNTERFSKEVISVPNIPELTDGQVEYTIQCIRDFYSK